MKTEIENITATSTMNSETPNTPAAETSTATANNTETNKTEAAASPAPDNTARLAELAVKIRETYATEHEADGMVVNWKDKQLKAGIQMGQYLIEAKKLVPPKGFIKWCGANFSELNVRTLNRYMLVARNLDKTEVSQSKGLGDAYAKCSGVGPDGDSGVSKATDSGDAGENVGGAEPEAQCIDPKDWKKIRQHLSKAKDMLNGITKITTCGEANAVCDLVDALSIWVEEYRGKANRLNDISQMNFEFSLNEGNETPSPELEDEFVTTE